MKKYNPQLKKWEKYEKTDPYKKLKEILEAKNIPFMTNREGVFLLNDEDEDKLSEVEL